MKVALVRPNYHTHLVTPQLGLGYLSSYLRQKGIETVLIDGLNQELSAEELSDRCRPFDAVGITCLTDYFPEASALSRMLKISWAAPNGVRADTLDGELLTLMKKSGCYFLAFGLESGNQAILDHIHKNVDLATIRKTIAEAEHRGIMTQGFFIFGLPGETEATIQETIRFA